MMRITNYESRITITAPSFDHAATNALDLAVMGEDVDTSIAAAEKRAQQPADETDDNRTPKRAPKTGNFETGHDLAYEEQH